MPIAAIVAIFNIVAPEVFGFIDLKHHSDGTRRLNMPIAAIVAIFNIVAPEVFGFINSQKQKVNPTTGQPFTYAEILEMAGIKLDAEHEQLLRDMAADMAEGAH
jgi:hypothetical protein